MRGARRFEYTVIGNPVNQAARLCALAKRRDERLLAASAAALERAPEREAAGWEPCDEIVLRGRSSRTQSPRPIDAPRASRAGGSLRSPGMADCGRSADALGSEFVAGTRTASPSRQFAPTRSGAAAAPDAVAARRRAGSRHARERPDTVAGHLAGHVRPWR